MSNLAYSDKDGNMVGSSAMLEGRTYAHAPRAVNPQTGTSYTPVLTDAGKLITMTNAGASTFTVPPNSSVPFPVYTEMEVLQLGAGLVTLAAGAGVTVNAVGAHLAMAGQYARTKLIQTAANVWVASGGQSLT
jgi:hypothetical protein